jgi:hypothetical protein
MNEATKTLAFLGVAALLFGAAYASTRVPDRVGTDLASKELGIGQPFFPDFKDPNAATSLEVIEYDEATATQRPFKVEFKDGKWTIPSHYDYPADGKDRLVKTATGVIDLKKDTVRSITAEDHEKLGVIDPLDGKSTALKGRGKRVTLKGKDGNVLGDFIIGKPVKTDEKRTGQRYVRVPDQKPTYGVKLDLDLSTKFADWIETNLLKLESGKVRRITFNSDKADIRGNQIVMLPGESYTISRKDASGPWTIQGLEADQEVATDKVSDLTFGLSDLKINGVRPKPAGLTRDLKVSDPGKIVPSSREGMMSLVNRGFYPTERGVLSNQGEVEVATEEGVVYTLRFGEATFAQGEALSAGSEDEVAKAEDAKDKDKDDEGTSEKKSSSSGVGSRFLMVTVRFDDSLIAKPESLSEPEEGDLPKDVFQRTEEEQKTAKEKADREKVDFEKKVADGKKKVDDLSDRFAGWYYLTPDSNFKKIALERSAAVRKKGEKPATGGAAPDFGGGDLPPGLTFPPGGHP